MSIMPVMADVKCDWCNKITKEVFFESRGDKPVLHGMMCPQCGKKDKLKEYKEEKLEIEKVISETNPPPFKKKNKE